MKKSSLGTSPTFSCASTASPKRRAYFVFPLQSARSRKQSENEDERKWRWFFFFIYLFGLGSFCTIKRKERRIYRGEVMVVETAVGRTREIDGGEGEYSGGRAA
jgi:hypothetical protein